MGGLAEGVGQRSSQAGCWRSSWAPHHLHLASRMEFILPSLSASDLGTPSDACGGHGTRPPDCGTEGLLGPAPGRLGAQPSGDTPWAKGAKLGHQLKAVVSCLVAGILKSKRNDPSLALLVSCGIIWWVSYQGEGSV